MTKLKCIPHSAGVLRFGTLALGCFGLGFLCSEALAQSSIQEWQAKAVQEFPELGVQNSQFNRLFLEKAALLREKSPHSLTDPSWPYRLAVRIAEHPELLRPSTVSALGRAESGGDLSAGIAELCVNVIKQKVAAENSKEKLDLWVSGDKVLNARRVQALLGADAATPELRPALAAWVRKMRESQGHNSEEDRLWLQAFLSAEKLQGPVAALEGLDLVDFQFRLLGETESMEFAELWLAGKPTVFLGGSKGLTAGRVRVLEMAQRNRFKIGALAVRESFCMETFYAYEQVSPGEGFILLDQVPVAQWPEKMLTTSKPPLARFNAQKQDWVNYLSRVLELNSSVIAGKPVSIQDWSKEEVRPGALEHFVLWKSRRLDSSQEIIAWMESVSVQFGRHPSAVIRDLRRVFPALAYVLRGQAQKATEQ